MSTGTKTLQEPPALSAAQRDLLRRELHNPDLDIFHAVRSAREELSCGHFDAAVLVLRMDADKIRTISPELAKVVTFQHGSGDAAYTEG